MEIDLLGKSVAASDATPGALVGLQIEGGRSFAIRLANSKLENGFGGLLIVTATPPADESSTAFPIEFRTDWQVFEFERCRIKPSIEPTHIEYGAAKYGSLVSADGKIAFQGNRAKIGRRYFCVVTGEEIAGSPSVNVSFTRWSIVQPYKDDDGKERERMIYEYPPKEKAAP